MIDRMISLRRMPALFGAASLLVCLVFADGPSRKPTEAEKAYNRSTIGALAKALPAAPEGWVKAGATDPGANLNEAYSEPNEPLRVDCYAVWKNTNSEQQSQMQFNEELMKLTQKPGIKPEEIEALQKKFETKDTEARIDVTANYPGSMSIYDKVTTAPAIGGGLVYRTAKAVYVFLGKGWKTTTGGGTYVGFTPDKSITSSTVIQNIVVKIQAEPGRIDQLAQKVNWDALNALIRK
jgi:hypothetical protein